MSRFVLLLLSLSLSACVGSNISPLDYSSPTAIVPGSGQISVGAVTDTRGRENVNSYGVVRGLYGNPIKSFSTQGPVADTVSRAFGSALAARGMLARSPGGMEIRVNMSQFDATSYFRLEAKVTLVAQLVDAGGRVLGEFRGQSMKVRGTANQIGGALFSDMNALAGVAPVAMSDAIDQIVDDPAFRRAVAGAGAGRPGV